jgi:hypothetical protein
MDYYKMFTGSAAEAYGRWIAEQEALGAERMDSICERPNDACAEIICEHIKAHLRGEVCRPRGESVLRNSSRA